MTPLRPARSIRPEALAWESGPHVDPSWTPQRVALIAHWSTEGKVSRSLSELVRQLTEREFDVVVISSSDAPQLMWPSGLPERTTVMRRPNIGHDFGSWAAVLNRFPGIRQAPRVILTNDSLVGPFRDLERELSAMERTSVDVWGLQESHQMLPHLMSFFLCFRDGVLTERPLRRFWQRVRPHPTKAETVTANEIGLAILLRQNLYTVASYYPAVPGRSNPTIDGWSDLLRTGFPFVKRMLVAGADFAHADFSVTREDIADDVRGTFGVELMEWL